MNKDKARETLEFLISFFSMPDKSFFVKIYNGETPLGKIDTSDTFELFYQNIEEEITEIFINSPKQRPLYPLASEYLNEHDDKLELINDLNEIYLKSGKIVKSYPPDHFIVLCEFILDNLCRGDNISASDFYFEYLENWTQQFAEVIVERKPSKSICQVAGIIKSLDMQFRQERITDERNCQK